MVGVVLYGHLKHAAGQDRDDCFDGVCPNPVVRFLDSSKTEESYSETEPLSSHVELQHQQQPPAPAGQAKV